MVLLLQDTLSTLSEVKGQEHVQTSMWGVSILGSVVFSWSVRHLTCHPSLESCPFFRRWGPALSDSCESDQLYTRKKMTSLHDHIVLILIRTSKTYHFFSLWFQTGIILHFSNKTYQKYLSKLYQTQVSDSSKSLWRASLLFFRGIILSSSTDMS